MFSAHPVECKPFAAEWLRVRECCFFLFCSMGNVSEVWAATMMFRLGMELVGSAKGLLLEYLRAGWSDVRVATREIPRKDTESAAAILYGAVASVRL